MNHKSASFPVSLRTALVSSLVLICGLSASCKTRTFNTQAKAHGAKVKDGEFHPRTTGDKTTTVFNWVTGTFGGSKQPQTLDPARPWDYLNNQFAYALKNKGNGDVGLGHMGGPGIYFAVDPMCSSAYGNVNVPNPVRQREDFRSYLFIIDIKPGKSVADATGVTGDKEDREDAVSSAVSSDSPLIRYPWTCAAGVLRDADAVENVTVVDFGQRRYDAKAFENMDAIAPGDANAPFGEIMEPLLRNARFLKGALEASGTPKKYLKDDGSPTKQAVMDAVVAEIEMLVEPVHARLTAVKGSSSDAAKCLEYGPKDQIHVNGCVLALAIPDEDPSYRAYELTQAKWNKTEVDGKKFGDHFSMVRGIMRSLKAVGYLPADFADPTPDLNQKHSAEAYIGIVKQADQRVIDALVETWSRRPNALVRLKEYLVRLETLKKALNERSLRKWQ